MKKASFIQYTISERRGIAILIVIIVFINIVTVVSRSLISPDFPEIMSEQVVADSLQKDRIKEEPLIELNSADSISIMKLYGIGPTFSKRIIKYRELLGGYYNKNQLLEVYGMDTVRLTGFVDQVYLDTGLIRKINLRTVSFRDLLRHPYIDIDMVKSFVKYRDENGPPSDIRESCTGSGWTDSTYRKLQPYLTLSH
jgi:DNA uptake protein ComE-like DNA-binding protein